MHLFGILEAKETPVLRQICKVLWWTWASLQQSLANLAPQDKTEQVEETKRKRKSLWEPWFFFESCRRRVGNDCVKQLFWAEWHKNETSQNAILDNSNDFWLYIVNHSHIVLRQVMLIFLSLAHVLHDVNWWLGQFPKRGLQGAAGTTLWDFSAVLSRERVTADNNEALENCKAPDSSYKMNLKKEGYGEMANF